MKFIIKKVSVEDMLEYGYDEKEFDNVDYCFVCSNNYKEDDDRYEESCYLGLKYKSGKYEYGCWGLGKQLYFYNYNDMIAEMKAGF